jgi:hypothetical protein
MTDPEMFSRRERADGRLQVVGKANQKASFRTAAFLLPTAWLIIHPEAEGHKG